VHQLLSPVLAIFGVKIPLYPLGYAPDGDRVYDSDEMYETDNRYKCCTLDDCQSSFWPAARLLPPRPRAAAT